MRNTVGSVDTQGLWRLAQVASNAHRLIVAVADKKASSEELQVEWQGETKSVGQGDDLLSTLDFLLIPTIDRIGRNSNDVVKLSVSDTRIKDLRQP